MDIKREDVDSDDIEGDGDVYREKVKNHFSRSFYF